MRTSTSARHVGQPVADGDRVVAGVEDEQRDLAVAREQPDQSAIWSTVAVVGSCVGRDAHDVDGGGPAVGSPVQLADPLVGPAGHDGLAGRVLGRRVVEAPLGAALGVAAVPGRGVDGEDQRPARRPVLDQQLVASQSSSMLPRPSAL